MPMTGSTLAGGITFRRVFGLISSNSTDGTAVSLTIAHGFGTVLVPNATVATQNIVVDLTAVSAAGATSGWYVASVDATNIVFGRSALSAGAAAAVSCQANVRFVQAIID